MLQVRTRLRVRDRAPSPAALIARVLEPGDLVSASNEVSGEAVSGNAAWYRLDDDKFVWSGGVIPAPGTTIPGNRAALPVSTYPNGHIRVLDESKIRAVFGTFAYTEANPRGAIRIDPAWIQANLVEIELPALAAIGHPKVSVHRLAAGPFRRVFAALQTAGLDGRILTCGGTFVPRHKTWNPDRGLSSHSWGIAIDLNVAWNGYGVTPPPLGAIGSVRELIPFFAGEGFGWGGDFSEPDGMHFELALKHIV